jgi:hypothetical protein
MTKRKYSGLVAASGLPKHVADAFAKFVAWSAQVDTVDEQSSPDPNPHHISASNITPQQDAAHHAYFGGPIESVKQGYVEILVLHRYDIASVYPSAVVQSLMNCCEARRAEAPSALPKHLADGWAAFLAWSAHKRAAGGHVPSNSPDNRRHGRFHPVTPDTERRYRDIRRRERAGELISDDEWHWVIDYARQFKDRIA